MKNDSSLGSWDAEDDKEALELFKTAAEGEFKRLVERLKKAEEEAKKMDAVNEPNNPT